MMFNISLSSRADFSKLYKLINSNIPADEEMLYDLSDFRFFEPLDILLLTMPIIYFKERNIVQKYIPPRNIIVHSYIKDIGLFEFCRTNYQQPETIEAIQSQSAMPLRRINTKTMNQYIELAKGYFNRHCPDKDLDFLNITISELINNVNDHSLSDIDAYIFCQYYPRINVIKVVVAILGLGSPLRLIIFL